MTVVIDASRISDWASFHDVFAEAFGFPTWYGRNMDAWIDCMRSIDDPTAELSRVHVRPGEIVTMQVEYVAEFAVRSAEQYRALVECTDLVNEDRATQGLPPLLALAFRDSEMS